MIAIFAPLTWFLLNLPACLQIFLSAKFTLFFAKFYESRFFMQAKFDAKFIPHKPSRFCYFIKIRGLTSSAKFDRG